MDFTKYFSRKIYTTEAWKMSTKNHIIFWLTKLNYAIFFIAIPVWVWGWQGWLVGYLIMNAVMGMNAAQSASYFVARAVSVRPVSDSRVTVSRLNCLLAAAAGGAPGGAMDGDGAGAGAGEGDAAPDDAE